MIVGAGPLSLADDAMDTLSFALLVGGSIPELRDAALRADSVLTDVEESGEGQTLPGTFTLYQNYPNPFNPATAISFDLPRRSEYTFEVINALGQTLLSKTDIAGPGRIDLEWSGDGYASGMYFYRLSVGDRSETRKMMLLK
jgi:hypothetical protein